MTHLLNTEARRFTELHGKISSSLILVLALAVAGCSGPDSAKALSTVDKPISVQVVTATEAESPVTVPVLGAITSQSHASLGSELDGRVVSLLVKEGDHVKAGQAVIQLTSDDAQARLNAAKGGLETASQAATSDERIASAKLNQAKLDFTTTQDRLNSDVTLATAKLGEAQANYDRLKRGARPEEIESADADVAGVQLLVQADQSTVDFEKRTLKRKADLYAQGGISLNEVDQEQLNYDHAVQAVQQAQAQLRSKQLLAKLLKEGTPKEELAQAAAQVSAAKEGLRAARANLASLDDARQAVAVAQADYDRASARLKQLQAGGKASDEGAKVQLAQEDLQRTQIRAPIDGVVASIKVGRGQVVKAGQTVAEVVSQGGLRMEATALDQDVDQIRAGMAVRITLHSDPGHIFHGFVQSVLSPSSESRTPRVLISLPNVSGLTAGSVASGDVVTTMTHKVLSVPLDATFGQVDTVADVFVVDGNVVHQRPVQVGSKTGDSVQVVSGLSAGDMVVAKPARGLHDCSMISIAAGGRR